jgi:hypothetical protein
MVRDENQRTLEKFINSFVNLGVVENYSKLPEHFKLKSKEMFNK